MIIGRGLLAKALSSMDNDKYLFYVNGISNSVLDEIAEKIFEEVEIKSIAGKINNKTFVYFSTIQVNVSENFTRPYVQHKIKMESLIKMLFPNYLIIRTSNLVGNNPWNKHTLFNFLYYALNTESEVTIYDSALRNVLDVEHFIKLFNYYLTHFKEKNSTRNIVNPVSFNMAEIIKEYENIFHKKFKRGHSRLSIAQFEAPCAFSLSLVNSCNINLEKYLHKVITKYYQPIIKTKNIG